MNWVIKKLDPTYIHLINLQSSYIRIWDLSKKANYETWFFTDGKYHDEIYFGMTRSKFHQRYEEMNDIPHEGLGSCYN
jgi:hypothetical protein